MKLVFLDMKTIGPVPNEHILDRFGEVAYYQTTSAEETWDRVKDADVIITSKVILNRDLIGRAEKLKMICIAATGMNNVDREAANNRGIPVKNVSGYSTNSVAQGTFALLLHLVHKVRYFDDYVKNGEYSQNDMFTHFGRSFNELTGKRFGIIGLGNIGQQVARLATAFGCEVVYYSASGKNYHPEYLRLDLEELLSTSDIISIHAPLNEQTANLLNYERFLMMKKSAIVLNAGRGGIVNEADLAKALDEDVIAGAGIDVFSKEPINPDNPLLKVKSREKIVLTPHVTWASIESRTLLMEKVSDNIEEYIKESRTIKL